MPEESRNRGVRELRRTWRRADTPKAAPIDSSIVDAAPRKPRVALIVNPYSSGMTGKREREIVLELRQHADVELLRTERPGHASDLAKTAMFEGVDVIIACGGDGTGNEVLSGVELDNESAERLPAFALIPAGGTNVLCRSLELPNHPIAAVRKLAPALADLSGRTRIINLGRVDERIFMFSAGVGFDGEVVKRIDAKRRGRRPSDFSHLVTIVGMFASERWAYKDSMTLTIPESNEELRASLLMVGNTSPMSYVGRMALNFMPECTLEGGLDFLAPTRTTAYAAIRNSARAMGMGRKGRERAEMQPHHDIDSFTVVCDEAQPVQVDGEYLGDRTHIQFSLVRNCIKLVV
ncbi:MAG: hypothetical protein H7123_04245 [Thermoleophilia bacterium]|nr:hypothetical protein [Thermoleophilia bacterium]